MSRTTESGLLGRPHPPTRHARRQDGRARREIVPLAQHATIAPQEGRTDPVAILTSQDAGRLRELVPLRHQRMAASPFSFFRGGAAVMASDLARLPSSEIRVQLCGDAHCANFGVYRGPDRRLVFDLNDFDETHLGPFEWDVKRLAASIAIAAHDNELSRAKTERAVAAAVRSYRTTVDGLSRNGPLDVQYRRLEVDKLLAELTRDRHRRRAGKAASKAATRDHHRALRKLTEVVDGRRRIAADPPIITRVDERVATDEIARVVDFFDRYLRTIPPHLRRLLDRYVVVDVARKVVGVGSVGMRCLIVLLETGDGEPLFLQLKEATASVLEPHLGVSDFEPGERVVVGQRSMQTMGDIFLGWSRHDGGDRTTSLSFYVRQLWDGKGSVRVERMKGRALCTYSAFCGSALAVAHARTGDAAVIAGYLGRSDRFDDAITEFAHACADVNERDHSEHSARTMSHTG